LVRVDVPAYHVFLFRVEQPALQRRTTMPSISMQNVLRFAGATLALAFAVPATPCSLRSSRSISACCRVGGRWPLAAGALG